MTRRYLDDTGGRARRWRMRQAESVAVAGASLDHATHMLLELAARCIRQQHAGRVAELGDDDAERAGDQETDEAIAAIAAPAANRRPHPARDFAEALIGCRRWPAVDAAAELVPRWRALGVVDRLALAGGHIPAEIVTVLIDALDAMGDALERERGETQRVAAELRQLYASVDRAQEQDADDAAPAVSLSSMSAEELADLGRVLVKLTDDEAPAPPAGRFRDQMRAIAERMQAPGTAAEHQSQLAVRLDELRHGPHAGEVADFEALASTLPWPGVSEDDREANVDRLLELYERLGLPLPPMGRAADDDDE